MTTQSLSAGTVHDKIPTDLRKALLVDKQASDAWESITPLARNEWICWVESPKQASTRDHRVERTVSELVEGMRRPCCWIGCIHRTDKAISPSVRGILDRRSKRSS